MVGKPLQAVKSMKGGAGKPVTAIATFLLKTTFEMNSSCSKHLQTYHVHRMTLQSYIISKVDFAHQGLFLHPSTGFHTAAQVLGRLGVA